MRGLQLANVSGHGVEEKEEVEEEEDEEKKEKEERWCKDGGLQIVY